LVSALQRKLLRDLFRMRGQVITIALVVASGIASYVSLQCAWSSLAVSREAYETHYRFAEVFAHAERVPNEVAARLGAIPGVAVVHPRIVERVRLPMPGMTEPATGRVISLPDEGNAPLNAVYLRAGRLPEPSEPNEVVLYSSFGARHGIGLGDTFPAIINGRQRDLQIVGLGLSPEYIMPMAEGDMAPNDEAFAVIWMRESTLAGLFDMRGAFNDAIFDVEPHASEQAVIDEIDRELESFGSNGAYGRNRQLSSHAVDSEMQQLETFATVIPAVFLAVAAFLLNVVLSRVVQLQRPQIASLKALGYYDREVALHYLMMMFVVVLIGTALGVGVGSYLGSGMTHLYARFYRFPILIFRLDAAVVVRAVGISAVAALVGAFATVRSVAKLPPAEAMRPEAPGRYGRSLLDRIGIFALFGPSVRMVVREMFRRPLRLGLSVVAIAMAGSILVLGRYSQDAFSWMMDLQFTRSWREDLTVTFAHPVPIQTARDLISIDGVIAADGVRAVGARISSGQRERDVGVTFVDPDLWMREVWDIDEHRWEVPDDGIMITGALGRVLHVRRGDVVTLQILEGNRRTVDVPVAGLIEEPFGLNSYLDADYGRRLLGEDPVANMAVLRVDADRTEAVEQRLTEIPSVFGILRKSGIRERFDAQMGEMMFTMTLILTLLAATIAVGVVYNNARIALSMRSRDLASLRVLGFTRPEIAAVFYGEMAIQILLAIPLGFVLGRQMTKVIAGSMDPEIFRLPTVVSPDTYAFAALVLVASGVLSGVLVHRRLRSLDLIGVLKARE
jgi:putative ABC transport system permease protein